MVDRDSVLVRLAKLAELLERLERTRGQGLENYLGNDDLRAATERRLQLADQLCIDVAAHLVSELNAPAPESYAATFTELANAGVLEPELAVRLGLMAAQRNLLVHAYPEVDSRRLFASLNELDGLREFARAAQAMVDADLGP